MKRWSYRQTAKLADIREAVTSQTTGLGGYAKSSSPTKQGLRKIFSVRLWNNRLSKANKTQVNIRLP